MSSTSAEADTARQPPSYLLWQLVRYMLGLGTWGFGGPVALLGYMYRDLVEKRNWIAEGDYKEGMALAQLMPGPLAAQLAIYLGYVHYRIRGATLVGVAFVLPSFLMVVAIGAVYTRYGGIGWMQAVFYGVGAAVIGIIAISAYKLTSKNIGRDRLLWAIFAVSTAVTVITKSEIVWVFLGAGVLVWLVRAPPAALGGTTHSFAAPILAWFALDAVDWHKLGQIGAYFAYAGSFVFGSGLAIVPFLYGGVVQEYHWLTDRQFVDAVAVAMITPGPVVITVAFIGYLVAGVAGGTAAAVGVFLPTYLFVVVPYRWFDRFGENPQVKAFVNGVTAAAAGAIAGACVVLGRRAIFDLPTALIGLAAFGLLWRLKVPEPILIAAAGITGLIIFWIRGAL